jgi:hypothetical protein
MVNVILVDGKTRMHLPNSRWAMDVQISLSQMGHQLRDLGQAPEHDMRDQDEKARVAALLDSTGL